MHPNVYSSSIDNSQSIEKAQMSIDGWMDKEDVVCVCVYVYTHTHTRARAHTHTHAHTHKMEYYSAIKKNEILPFATTWMELEGIILSEISQRKTEIIWLHSYEDFKRKPDEHKKKETKII